MLSVLLVDADAPTGGDGLTWATAYNDLQPALARSATLNADADPANNIDSIWIAEGTYKPTSELEPGDPRSASFSLVNNVTLYGGFAGAETALEQRDWTAHPVTLSGDLGTPVDNSDNAYTVVYCSEGIEIALDGLQFIGGNGNGVYDDSRPERRIGGGVYSLGNLALIQCVVSENTADHRGGGVYCTGTLTIADCQVSNNSTIGRGGGIYCCDTL
ncbi:MAG: hypothetical protein JW818_01550, partial [Pirellulales bacterium]|nr:hypothetical protein [Pirellulales bacterium]